MTAHASGRSRLRPPPEGDKLITSGAHYLQMSKKDLVEAAVAFYLDANREEMQGGWANCRANLTVAACRESRCWPG
jgi:hypothetical protein